MTMCLDKVSNIVIKIFTAVNEQEKYCPERKPWQENVRPQRSLPNADREIKDKKYKMAHSNFLAEPQGEHV